MPKGMYWIEKIFNYFPIGRRFSHQMLARFCFLTLLWLVGLLSYASDGLATSYISKPQFYQYLFGAGFIVFFGSYMMQRSLHGVVLSFRPLLELDASQFRKLVVRVERYSYSFVPCLAIGLFLLAFFSGTYGEFQGVMTYGLSLYRV